MHRPPQGGRGGARQRQAGVTAQLALARLPQNGKLGTAAAQCTCCASTSVAWRNVSSHQSCAFPLSGGAGKRKGQRMEPRAPRLSLGGGGLVCVSRRQRRQGRRTRSFTVFARVIIESALRKTEAKRGIQMRSRSGRLVT